jgi:cytochrome c-type biogenesis protein CcmH/NrfG
VKLKTRKNKINYIKMNKFKIFSVALLASVTVSHAQDLDQAKKAIDAEQFESAKSLLKTLIQTKPANGKAAFLLGNVYLTQNIADSAKIYFQKGLAASEGSKLNYIGLGQMDLDNGNLAAAQANFALATSDIKKKDIEQYIYIAKAYMNSNKPDYKNALGVLSKAKLVNPQDAQLQLVLGDAFYGDKNQNDAYLSYRNAFQADASLIRAKMQLGVLLKGAKAYTEAVAAFDNVTASNPSYGPVYRELAETYYYWGVNAPKNYKENVQKALGYYEKYMSLTDYSLMSRMRHADFLILTKDYKALELEANKMKELDNVNPRILRYLGYSAYENGNTDAAIQALESFIANPANKIIARDYLYLGLAKMRKATNPETKVVDASVFGIAVSNIKKAVEMELTMTNDLNEVGKKFYEQKLFKEAAAIYEIATTNVNSPNYLLDNFYLGNSLYYDNNRKEVVKPDPIALQKADAAFANVITASPTTQDAYIFRARTNKLLEKDDLMTKFYEEYINVVTAKGAEELAKPAIKTKFIEAYNNIAASYANFDKTKAKEYFGKTLALDPTNKYATESLKTLK